MLPLEIHMKLYLLRHKDKDPSISKIYTHLQVKIFTDKLKTPGTISTGTKIKDDKLTATRDKDISSISTGTISKNIYRQLIH